MSEKSADRITDLIVRVGFPIVIAMALLWYGSQKIDQLALNERESQSFIRNELTAQGKNAIEVLTQVTEVMKSNEQVLKRTSDVLQTNQQVLRATTEALRTSNETSTRLLNVFENIDRRTEREP